MAVSDGQGDQIRTLAVVVRQVQPTDPPIDGPGIAVAVKYPAMNPMVMAKTMYGCDFPVADEMIPSNFPFPRNHLR